MKTEQILLAITIHECGSITKAAQRLFMAQPNASNSIHSLEEELGYCIFERTPNGIKVTPKGEKFLQYAHSIQRNLSNIALLKDEKEKIHLFVAAYAYPFAENAFAKFCKINAASAASMDCALRRIGTIKEGIDMLVTGMSDVSVFVCNRELLGHYEKIPAEKSYFFSFGIYEPASDDGREASAGEKRSVNAHGFFQISMYFQCRCYAQPCVRRD